MRQPIATKIVGSCDTTPNGKGSSCGTFNLALISDWMLPSVIKRSISCTVLERRSLGFSRKRRGVWPLLPAGVMTPEVERMTDVSRRAAYLIIKHCVEVGGTTVAYTGDTGPSEVISELARDVDLFVCEATYPTPPASEGPRLLLSASEAGAYAQGARAKRLVLTHFWPGDDRTISLDLARKSFGGEALLAEQGMTIDLK